MEESEHTIIGPHKVFYARQKYGNQRTSARLETATEAAGWYWDKKKDLTRTNTKVETKVWTPGDEDYIEVTSAKGGIHEEHAVMIAFKPEKDPVTSKIWTWENYIKTFSLTKEEGEAVHVADKLHRAMIEQNSTHTVLVLGSDSTAKNTGQHGGVGALIEKKLALHKSFVFKMHHQDFLGTVFPYHRWWYTGPRIL